MQYNAMQKFVTLTKCVIWENRRRGWIISVDDRML